jgi:hypothetical protein
MVGVIGFEPTPPSSRTRVVQRNDHRTPHVLSRHRSPQSVLNRSISFRFIPQLELPFCPSARG